MLNDINISDINLALKPKQNETSRTNDSPNNADAAAAANNEFSAALQRYLYDHVLKNLKNKKISDDVLENLSDALPAIRHSIHRSLEAPPNEQYPPRVYPEINCTDMNYILDQMNQIYIRSISYKISELTGDRQKDSHLLISIRDSLRGAIHLQGIIIIHRSCTHHPVSSSEFHAAMKAFNKIINHLGDNHLGDNRSKSDYKTILENHFETIFWRQQSTWDQWMHWAERVWAWLMQWIWPKPVSPQEPSAPAGKPTSVTEPATTSNTERFIKRISKEQKDPPNLAI